MARSDGVDGGLELSREPALIRDLFDTIAARYDLANELLSLGHHHRWRRRAIAFAGVGPGERVLDLATGTGDLARLAAERVGPRGRVVGLDLSPRMLAIARRKLADLGERVELLEGDATRLPFPNASFDRVTMAFGIRNTADPLEVLREAARVVRPGGTVTILEFGQPRGPLGWLVGGYVQHLLPRIGGWLTGANHAYRYLARSSAAFPCGPAFLRLLVASGGYRSVGHQALQFGLVHLYRGVVA